MGKKYSYTIYRIIPSKTEDLRKKLLAREFEKKTLKESFTRAFAELSVEFYYCNKTGGDGIEWINTFNEYTEENLDQDHYVNGGVLLISSETFCYAVSYGNAHFYLSSFCDLTFGLSIAERLLDQNNISVQENSAYSSIRSKTLIDYLNASTLIFNSGEIASYVRGKSINENDWGKSIDCGISAQFSWEKNPSQLAGMILDLNEIVNSPDYIKRELPRMVLLNEDAFADKITELNNALFTAISTYDEIVHGNNYVNIPSYYFSGTKMVQNDFRSFRLSYNRKTTPATGDFDITVLKQFIQENQISSFEELSKVKIGIELGSGRKLPPEEVTKYLEFVTEDKYCMRGGKWFFFNDTFTKRIFATLRELEFCNIITGDRVYNRSILIQYAKQKGIEEERADGVHPYETYYNNMVAELLGASCFHPNTVRFENDFSQRIEPCDVYDDENFYFVKVGGFNELALAIDQAQVSISTLRNNDMSINTIKDGQPLKLKPRVFNLELILKDKVKEIGSWEEVNSLNFLMHLANLRQSINEIGFELKVDFIYNVDKYRPRNAMAS